MIAKTGSVDTRQRIAISPMAEETYGDAGQSPFRFVDEERKCEWLVN